MFETIFDIFKILGSLCLFIYGMKVMSEGIQGAAGSQLRNMLRRVTKNRYIGLISGFILTALVQSSSATTVMTVSFVNAGLLSLVESAGIIMGANVGTTITGWLVAVGIGKFELQEFVLPILVFGLPMIFTNRGRLRYWGEFLIGFALLFLGLAFLQDSVPDLQSNPDWLEFLKRYANNSYLSLFIFVIAGMVITIGIQSSSAAMALTLVMVSKGWIPLETAGAMILGENIGTTLTAEVAAFVGNVHAKRSARIHTLFNIIGVLWAVILLPWIVPALNNFVEYQLGNLSANSTTVTFALFHTLFNLTNVLLLIGFTPWLIRLAKRTVRSHGEEDEIYRLEYLGSLFKTPELSIIEVQKEVRRFGDLTYRMSGFARELFLSTNKEDRKQLHKRIKKYEDITNRIENELSEFLAKMSSDKLTPRISVRVRNLLSICSSLESIGDTYLQFSKSIKRKAENKIWFHQIQRERMLKLFDLIDEAFKVMLDNLANESYDKVTLGPAEAIEKQINKFRKAVRKESFDTNNNDEIEVDLHDDSQIIFTLLVNQLEKVGNGIHNVTEALTDTNDN